MTPTQTLRPRPIYTGLAVLALALIPSACSAAGAGTSTHKAVDDVSPVSCVLDEDVVRVTGTITNHSSKTSSYFVDVDVVVGDQELTSPNIDAQSVEPGETVPIEAVVRHAPSGEPRCVVTDVSRFKA